MMYNFIEPIERLVNAFRALPGVGLKTAQRYAYYIITNLIKPKNVYLFF